MHRNKNCLAFMSYWKIANSDHRKKWFFVGSILRQNGLLPRKKNVMKISNIVQETTCPQGLRTGFR